MNVDSKARFPAIQEARKRAEDSAPPQITALSVNSTPIQDSMIQYEFNKYECSENGIQITTYLDSKKC